MLGSVLTALLATVAGLAMLGGSVAAKGVYPQGTEFPLVLYSIEDGDIESVKRSGWNGVHSYAFKKDYLEVWKSHGVLGLAKLPSHRSEKRADSGKGLPEEQVTQLITELAASDHILWWDIPEEMRFWMPDEMAVVTNYTQWTRKHDPRKRPNYMYIPGGYSAEAVKVYVPYLDIVPASVYTTYNAKPHAWVRWRMETTIKGIELAGAKIGDDYLKGEKTPVAVLELFRHMNRDPKLPPQKLMTPEGAYHDFWQSVVSGARGILIFSYYHRDDAEGQPTFQKNWQMYCKSAEQITGPEQLGQMILHGVRDSKIKCEVLSGPKRTVEFVPSPQQPGAISYPSLDLLAKTWKGNTYVIVVNSAEESVTAEITGLPKAARSATMLFGAKDVAVRNGRLKCELGPLGVRIFRLASSW